MPRYDSFGVLDTPYLDEVDTFFSKMNGRLRPDQLKPGELAMSINGRMDVDGSWQPRKGINVFGSVISVGGNSLVIPFYLYGNKVIDQADRVNTVVTIRTTTAHNFTDGTQVGIDGISGTVDPTGNQTITYIDSTHFSYVIAGATGSETYTLGGTPRAGAPLISAINTAYGSCRFSDPRNSNADYIVMALNMNAVAVNLLTGASTTIAYPTGITITAEVNMVQAFDKIYIFRTGATALSWDGVLTGSPAFAKVANGAYTQPLVLTSSNNAVASGGVVTITNTHNLAVGQTVVIMDAGTTGLTKGDSYQVASISTTVSFTFYASVDDFSATSVVIGARQSNGRGFTHMPAPSWGVYHQRRLIVPFAYTTSGSSGSETITARNISDEMLLSDILDSDTYDILQNQFRVTGGVADYLQTIHPFTNDAAIAFNRNSLHLVTGLSGDLNALTITAITNEAGLVARKSVVTIGNSVFFLSDNGVYAANFGDLYNLRGAGLPRSDEINPIIKRINTAYAHRSVGIFHDNRYYLAFPIDTSTVNNAIIVYNLLNGGWESLDIVNQDGWDVSNFIIATPNGINQLYAINRYGGIHILDNRVDDVDNVYLRPGASATSYFIEASAITRMYSFNNPERKKFNSFEVHVESTDSNESDGTFSGIFENQDDTADLGSISSILGSNLPVSGDSSLRGRIGLIRSYGGQMEFSPTVGRPKLRLVKVTAAPTFRALTQAS